MVQVSTIPGLNPLRTFMSSQTRLIRRHFQLKRPSFFKTSRTRVKIHRSRRPRTAAAFFAASHVSNIDWNVPTKQPLDTLSKDDTSTPSRRVIKAETPVAIVKIGFKITPKSYDTLVSVLPVFNDEELDSFGVIQRLGGILQSNPHLIRNFDIAFDAEDLGRPSGGQLRCQTLFQAGLQLYEIRITFKVAVMVWNGLIRIVEELRKDGISTPASIQRVGNLIYDNTHLVHNISVVVLGPSECHWHQIEPEVMDSDSDEQKNAYSESMDYSKATSRTKSTEYGIYYRRMALSMNDSDQEGLRSKTSSGRQG